MMLTRNSNTRVTLALDIVRKIDKGQYAGYHELGTVKHQIDLCDTVSVEPAQTDSLSCDDPAVPCDGRNVCLKAVRLVQSEFGIDRHVRIHLQKRIPVMGGLAGGSANAATTFRLLNELWELGLPRERLVELSRNIGMDVPYFFFGGTAFDSEAGLRLEPVPTECSLTLVLACPDFGVSTREAYAGIDYGAVGRRRQQTEKLCASLMNNDRAAIVAFMHNDFEMSVFSRFPRLGAIKQELLQAGCQTAMMTGSGSTILGVAENRDQAQAVCSKISCRTIVVETCHRA